MLTEASASAIVSVQLAPECYLGYPDFGYTKLFGVPLFSGFMYAAVGSYIIQAWRLVGLRVVYHPPYWMACAVAVLIYLNFFTHHYIGHYRWYKAHIDVPA